MVMWRTAIQVAGAATLFSAAAYGADLTSMVLQGRLNAMEQRVAVLEKQLKGVDANLTLTREQLDRVSETTAADSPYPRWLLVRADFGQCPKGFNKRGRVGLIGNTADMKKWSDLNKGATYGDGSWTWLHPLLCTRDDGPSMNGGGHEF